MNRFKQKIFSRLIAIEIELTKEENPEEVCSYCALKLLIDMNAVFGFNVINQCQHYIDQHSTQNLLRCYRCFLISMSWIYIGILVISPFFDELPEFQQINIVVYGATKPSIITISFVVLLFILIAMEINYTAFRLRITLSKELDKVMGNIRHILPYSVSLALFNAVVIAILWSEYNINSFSAKFMWKFELVNALISIYIYCSTCSLILFLQLIIILIVNTIVAFRKIADDLKKYKNIERIPNLLQEIDFRHEDLTRFVYQLNDGTKNAIGIVYFISLAEISLLMYASVFETYNQIVRVYIISITVLYLITFTVFALVGGEIENAVSLIIILKLF